MCCVVFCRKEECSHARARAGSLGCPATMTATTITPWCGNEYTKGDDDDQRCMDGRRGGVSVSLIIVLNYLFQ